MKGENHQVDERVKVQSQENLKEVNLEDLH